MTFRTRTSSQPTRRRARRSDTRRNIYITITFSLAIAVALSLFGGVFLASYYTSHWAPIAAVNGQAISTDDLNTRESVNLARYSRLLTQYGLLRNQAKLTSTEYSSFQSSITSSQSSVAADSLKELEGELTIRQYASKNNISVTSQQVDDQIKKDGTIPELRHVLVIGVSPEPTPPAYATSTADEQAAQKQAQAYLDEVKGGKKWADVATESHAGDVGSSGTTGDVGLMTKTNTTLDPDLRAAIFALAKVNDITPIFKGTDGLYRFATVTEIIPQLDDPNWLSNIEGQTNGGAYRSREEALALRQAIQDSIEAKYVTGETTQRRVLEIGIAPGYASAGSGDEVSIKMMVFAPGNDTSSASSVAADDPKWADAKKRADDAFAKLKADPTKWDSMARDNKVNDDLVWINQGGVVPWIPADLFMAQTQSGVSGLGLPDLQTAVFADNLTPGQLIGPVLESSQGYVIAQFEGRRPAPDARMAQAQFEIASGADFATVASKLSETADAANGAELGWVSPYQLDSVQEKAIFSTPVGSVTPMVNDNGFHIYKVVEEQKRLPDAAAQLRLKEVVFARWVTDLQANALIWTNQTVVDALTSASPT